MSGPRLLRRRRKERDQKHVRQSDVGTMAPRDRGNGRSREGLKINLRSRLHKWPALGQLIGHEAPAGEACVPCARGNGPFDSCRIVFLLGSGFQWSLACACSQYSGAANKCSPREFLPSPYLSVRQHRPRVHILFQGGAPDRNSRYGRKQCARLFPSVQREGSGIFLFALPAQPTWQQKTQKQMVRAYFTQDGMQRMRLQNFKKRILKNTISLSWWSWEFDPSFLREWVEQEGLGTFPLAMRMSACFTANLG